MRSETLRLWAYRMNLTAWRTTRRRNLWKRDLILHHVIYLPSIQATSLVLISISQYGKDSVSPNLGKSSLYISPFLIDPNAPSHSTIPDSEEPETNITLPLHTLPPLIASQPLAGLPPIPRTLPGLVPPTAPPPTRTTHIQTSRIYLAKLMVC